MEVRIVADQARYIIGERVNGHVEIRLEKPSKIQDIVLKIRCLQTVDIKRKAQKGNYIICESSTISTQTESLTTGVHRFKFSPKLNDSLPASFTVNGDKMNASIRYEMHAEVWHSMGTDKSPNYAFNTFSKAPTDRPVQSQIFCLTKPIRWYGVMPKGLCEIVATLERTHYVASEVINLSTYVRNASSYDIISLQFQIFQFVQLRKSQHSTAVFEQRHNHQVLYKSDDWIGIAAQNEKTFVKELEIPERGCLASVESKLISCQHYLRVSATLRGASAGKLSLVELNVPIHITASLPPDTPVPEKLQKMRATPAQRQLPKQTYRRPIADSTSITARASLLLLKNS